MHFSQYNWTIETIVRRGRKIEPEPRHGTPWTVQEASLFIESIILGFPMNILVFSTATQTLNFDSCIDGRHRLDALTRFWDGEFALMGLQFLTHLEGKTFKDLEDGPPEAFNLLCNHAIPVSIASNLTQAEEKALYERLNSYTKRSYPGVR